MAKKLMMSLVRIYASVVQRGTMSIDDIPADYKTAVQKEIDDRKATGREY